MLEYINGSVVSCYHGRLVLDVGNIAFSVRVSTYTEMQLKQSQTAKVFVAITIRDDSIKIFGFISEEERELFHRLQDISGVGPSMALNILSGGPPQDLRKAILAENLGYFKKTKGVGPKTAKRIVLELKGSISNIHTSSSHEGFVSSVRIDGINALVSLGYNQMMATEVIEKIVNTKPNIDINDLIREALQEIKGG